MLALAQMELKMHGTRLAFSMRLLDSKGKTSLEAQQTSGNALTKCAEHLFTFSSRSEAFPPESCKPTCRSMKTVFYNSLAGTLGLPHCHPNGIPQECPLSMTVVAFWLRPLVLLIKHQAGTPRLLADDVMISAQGEHHESIFENAMSLPLTS